MHINQGRPHINAVVDSAKHEILLLTIFTDLVEDVSANLPHRLI
jgi:hypothetical protein